MDRSAVATNKDRSSATITFLRDVIASLKADGFVQAALIRCGQDATVVPPS